MLTMFGWALILGGFFGFGVWFVRFHDDLLLRKDAKQLGVLQHFLGRRNR